MFHFREAWWLLKRTWAATVRLTLIVFAAYLIAVLLGVLLVVLFRAGALAGLPAIGVALVTAPALMWAGFSISSAPYYGEEPIRVWPLFRKGFSRWGRMAGVGLVALLITLPIQAVNFALVIREAGGFPPNQPPQPSPAWTVWSCAFSLLMFLVTTYGLFAGLSAVRDDLRPWRAWGKAFRMLKGREWLSTLGVLLGIELGVYVLFAILGWLIGFPQGAIKPSDFGRVFPLAMVGVLVSWAMSWYFGLCQVSIWHRYHEGGSPVSAGLPAPEGEPVATA